MQLSPKEKDRIAIEPLGVRFIKGYDDPLQVFVVARSNLRQSHSEQQKTRHLSQQPARRREPAIKTKKVLSLRARLHGKDSWFRAVFRVGGPNESHIMADMQMTWPQTCRAWLPVALGPRGGVAEKPIQRRILVLGPDSEGHLQPKQVRKVQAIEMFFCAMPAGREHLVVG